MTLTRLIMRCIWLAMRERQGDSHENDGYIDEEAQSYLAYALICETMEGAFWNSGRRRRLYSKTFTEAEQRQIPRIKATAHKWCLVTGVPEKVRMRYSTYLLWQKLAMFCAEI